MRSNTLWLLATLVVGTACQDTTKLESEIAELRQRVATLERQAGKPGMPGMPGKAKAGKIGKVGKIGKAGKAKAGGPAKAKVKAKAKTKAPGPRGTLELMGEVTKVIVDDGKRTFPVPGMVPVGGYTLKAAFTGDAALTAMGPVQVGPGVTTITCDPALKSCTASTPAK